MPRFFENVKFNKNDRFILNAENSQHCSKVLRMKENDIITVCNCGFDYECEIVNTSTNLVECCVKNIYESASEPSVNVTIFQCLPKADKLETVIQKSVELGVHEIIPVLSSRCVSRPDEKKSEKKIERYKKIAKSACEQSGRGIIVDVKPVLQFNKAVELIAGFDKKIMFYEGGGVPVSSVIDKNMANGATVAVLIGPEGGFSQDEVEKAQQNGIITATLGKRILRTETAPLAAMTAIMLLSGNME